MLGSSGSGGYLYRSAAPSHTRTYLWPKVEALLEGIRPIERSVFDLGCGNGAFARHLSEAGYHVTGVDPSQSGISLANYANPDLSLEIGSAYDDLAAKYGQFSVVISLEVVEHLYAPRRFAETVYNLTKPGGVAIISTPYHGYLKNLALAVSGKMDRHFTALWDHGHIKFWSVRTLRMLLVEAGFENPDFTRVGRIAPLAKSMIARARRPD